MKLPLLGPVSLTGFQHAWFFLFLLAVLGLLARLRPGYFGFLAGYAALLLWQARRVRTDDPALALRLFKSNAMAGLVLFAALVAGTDVWAP